MKAKIYIILCYLIAITAGYLSFTYFNNHLNLLVSTLLADIVCTLVVFIFSVIFNNSSVYDPYWSAIPPLVILLWIISLEADNLFSKLILVLYLIWAIRLTMNWLINWKGLKHEDWRYVNFRNKFTRTYWLISLLAIHLFPTLTVFLGMIPIYFGLLEGSEPNILIFFIGLTIGLISVIISYLADKHLYNHRNSSDHEKSITSGIWKYSRHPNYLGELLFWLSNFILGMSYNINNYFSIIGIAAMVLLFNLYSIPAMEKRLLSRKDDYRLIMNEVPRLIPFRFKHFQKEIENFDISRYNDTIN